MIQDLKRLKKLIDIYSMNQITVDLHYRSTNTIYTWYKNKRIPLSARSKVKLYLNLMEKKDDKLFKRRA